MDSSVRRVVVMTETPESKQPYSMMHRALYANIVGHDTMFSFPHGCTIKQFEGTEYIVDHVTRLARPVADVPALGGQSNDTSRKAAEYSNGITKCRSVLQNLESRFKIAHNQLETSAHNAARHEANIKALQEVRAPTLLAPPPIANVIAQRCQDLSTVRALLSLVAQALRAASAEGVRNLKPHQLTALERVAPPLYEKYAAWKSGELKLTERSEVTPGVPSSATPSLAPHDNELCPNDEVVEHGSSTDGVTHEEEPTAEDGDGHFDEEDTPPVTAGAHTVTEEAVHDPDMDDDTFMPMMDGAATEAHTKVIDEAVAMPAPVDTATVSVEAAAPVATESIFVVEAVASPSEVDTPALVETTQTVAETTPVVYVAAPFVPGTTPQPATTADSNDMNASSPLGINSNASISRVGTSREREPVEAHLYLPECTQPSIVIHCGYCNAYLSFNSAALMTHDATHSMRAKAAIDASPVSELTNPSSQLPDYITHRAIPRRHVRLDEDNTFATHYTVVRSGCVSCRKDVALEEIVAHGTTQEHLDFVE